MLNWVPHLLSQYDCSFYCTMYDSCPFLYPPWQIMMWLYIVPYLYIYNSTSPFPSTSWTFDLFGKRIQAVKKHHEGFSDGYGFIFPLFIVILYLYERPVLNGLWIWGGKSSSNFTTSLFSDFLGFVRHLLSDAWLYLRLSNSLHLEKGVFSSSAFIFQNFLGEEFPFYLFYTTDDKSL